MISLHPWPEHLETVLLAKSAAKGAAKDSGDPPESLARHTALVLTRLADFIRLRPNLPHQAGQPRLWHCLYWAALLHDFGKATPGFQAALRPGGDPTLKEQWRGQRHEVFSLAFLPWLGDGLSDDERLLVAAAILSHHRDAEEIQAMYNQSEQERLGNYLYAIPAAHLAGLHAWLVTCGWAWAQQLGLDQYGVTAVAIAPQPTIPFDDTAVAAIQHGLRQYRKLVHKLQRQRQAESLIPLLALRGTLINADHSASAHAPALPALRLAAAGILTSRRLVADQLHQHQRAAAQTAGSALLIAPTGSGKTEAALLWAANQPHAPRLFYTLPYQASMNAMQTRLCQTFGEQNVGLQHGRSLLALYQQLMERDDADPKTAIRQAQWRQNLNQLNYPPVRVFSPYQILKAMYRLKGYEAQLTDYHSALFIFDEIHAYEVTRLALILKTIAYLRCHYNARFFIMSATFPRLIKGWLQDALGEAATLTAAPNLFAAFQRHHIQLQEGELLQNLHLVEAAARAGQSVLVACNLVANAQQAYDELQERLWDVAGIEIMLLHGRFHLRDRLQKEKAIQTYTGLNSPRQKPVLLIATQVVEVSLDIDLDTIYSEPAPLEALVQRFGRVNRTRRKGLVPVHIFTQPQDGQHIYDQRLIQATLAILQRENGRPLDENAIGAWLDEIYDGELAQDWQKQFAQTAAEFTEVVVNTLRPFASADPEFQERFNKLFDGTELLPADLQNEYYDMVEAGQTVAAQELLVPLSWGRYHALRQNGKVRWDDELKLPVAIVPYSSERGLEIA